MGNNKLILNPDKTEFILIGDDQIIKSMKSSYPGSLLDNIIEPTESVKSLSVTLDADNSMQRYMANLCRVCYCHLQELQRVRRYLPYEMAVMVANAFVSSHSGFCNSLFYHTKKHIYEFKMPFVAPCAN